MSDSNSCRATETFQLESPAETVLDLGGSATICPGQTHMLDPGSYWESYSWASNNGFKSSQQRVTLGDAGVYWLDAVSNNGCLVQDTFFLETSTDLLKANFLLPSEAMTGDTIVMIDISWPLPEHAIWSLPSEMQRLQDFGDIVYGQFNNNGLYEVSLTTILGECRDVMTKSIEVTNGEGSEQAGRLGNEAFVKDFALYPIPNEGEFDVAIEFIEESFVVLTVWNISRGGKVSQVEDSGNKSYRKHFDLRPLSAGNYSLRLDYTRGTKYIRFIVR